MEQKSDIITNQEFLSVYQSYLSQINQQFKSKGAPWDHIKEVLNQMNFKLCPEPKSKVSKFLKIYSYFFRKENT